MSDYPRWRRTVIAGDLIADDWCLEVAGRGAVARIIRQAGGPNDGMWFWAVQVDQRGKPYNGGTGYASSGAEARALCEAGVPPEFRPGGEAI